MVKILKWRDIERCYPHEVKPIKYGMTSKKRSSSCWICILIWLEYRYAVVSRGIYHKESWLCLSAQVTQESWWETQKPHVHMTRVWKRQTRWHRFWETGGTGFVSAEPTAICLKSRWHQFRETSGTGFLWVVTASFWGNGYLRPWSPTVACCWFWVYCCYSLLF